MKRTSWEVADTLIVDPPIAPAGAPGLASPVHALKVTLPFLTLLVACSSSTPAVENPNTPVSIPTEHRDVRAARLLPPNTSVLVTLDVQRVLSSTHRQWALALVDTFVQEIGDGPSITDLEAALTEVQRIFVPYPRDDDDPFYLIAETSLSARQALMDVGVPVEGHCQDFDAIRFAPELGTLRLSNGLRCGEEVIGVTIDEQLLIFGPEGVVRPALLRLTDDNWVAPTFPSSAGVQALAQVNANAMLTVVGIHDEWINEAPGLQQVAGSIDFMDPLEANLVAVHHSEEHAETTLQEMIQIQQNLRGPVAMLIPSGLDLTPELDSMQINRSAENTTFSLSVPGVRVEEIIETFARRMLEAPRQAP